MRVYLCECCLPNGKKYTSVSDVHMDGEVRPLFPEGQRSDDSVPEVYVDGEAYPIFPKGREEMAISPIGVVFLAYAAVAR